MRVKSNLFLLAFLAVSCVNTKEQEKTVPEITVSILPQEYFVKQIAGDFLKVNVMIPPGASPATYEPTPAQLTSLSESRIYLMMGYTGFELAWMDKLAAVNKDMKIYNLSDHIDLIMETSTHEHDDHDHQHMDDDAHHHHGGIDPHVWLSPKNARIIAANIYDALSAAYPEQKTQFEENLDRFINRIDSLDTHIRKELATIRSKAFFTYHPSLSYYARDYGLEQYPLELGGKTPSAGHIKMMIDTGKKNNIGVVFLQMQFDQKNAEVLADEIGAEIVQINPLDIEWYAQMMFITSKLKAYLQ